MPRIKIASIKTSNNQKRIVKTAQRAINISTAFDQQGSYKNSSEFFELACRYARFITAQEEPIEQPIREPRPTAEEIDWETVHKQNVTPELEEVYDLYPSMDRLKYSKPRPILSQHKYGEPFNDVHFQNANELTKRFYDQLVANDGNVLQALNAVSDLIKSLRGTFPNQNLVAKFFEESLGLSLAAYFKNNGFLSINNQITSYAQAYAVNTYFAEGEALGHAYRLVLGRPVEVDNQAERHSKILAYLKDLFKEELAQNSQKILPMIAQIMQQPGVFMTGSGDDQRLNVDKDDLLAVYFANDHLAKDDGYSEGIGFQEIVHRLHFIKKFGRENYDKYLANENNKASFSNNNHIQEKFKPFEDKPSPEALKNVMSFLMKYENAIGTSGYREIYFEKLNRILKQFGEDFVAQFFSNKSQRFDLGYIVNVAYSLILKGKSAEEISDLLLKNERSLANLAYNLQATDLAYEYLEKSPEKLQMFMDYVNRGLVSDEIFKNFPDAKVIIDNSLKTYLDWLVKNARGDVDNTRTLALGYSTLFLSAYRTFGEDVVKMNGSQMQKIVQNDAYDRIRYEQIIEKKNAPSIEQLQAKEDAIYQFIEDNHKSYSSDYYRYNQKDDPHKSSAMRKIAENSVVMFGNNPNAKHLAAKVQLPSPIDEENRKIGEDFLNLKTKGIYSFQNLTQLFKFIPPEIKSKYDTHELGILVSFFDDTYMSENNNKAIERFENAVNTIARKNPELYQRKGEKYYTLLKHFYMSPGTKIDNLDGLFGLLELARSSIKEQEAVKHFDRYEMFSPKNLSLYVQTTQLKCPECEKLRTFDSQAQKWSCSNCGNSNSLILSDIAELLKNKKGNMNLLVIANIISLRDELIALTKSFNALTQSNFNITSNWQDMNSRALLFSLPRDPDSGNFIGTEEEINNANTVRQTLDMILTKQTNVQNSDEILKEFLLARNDNDIQTSIENYLRSWIKKTLTNVSSEDFENMDIEKYMSDFSNLANTDFGELNLHDVKEAEMLNSSQHDVSFTPRSSYDHLSENHIRSNMYEKYLVSAEEVFKNTDLLVVVFGNELWKWLDKFTTQVHFNPNRTKDDPENITKFNELTDAEKEKIVHDSSQVVPVSAKSSRIKGIGRYLLQFYRDALAQDLKFIVTNWNKKVKIDRETSSTEYVVAEAAYMEPFKSDPNSLVNILRYQNLMKFFGDNPPKSMDFAYEVSKWYTVEDEDDEEDDRVIETEDDDSAPDIEELTDAKYRRLEEMYLLSQQIPLPKWAQINPVKVGKYIGRFLPREDARPMFLGQYTGCCQHPENAAYGAAFDAVLSPKACTFVIEDTFKKIHLQSYVWEDRDGNVCFDSFETGSRDFFYSEQRKSMAAQIIRELTSQMGNIKVTGGNGLQNIFRDVTKTYSLQNTGEGRAVSYKAFGGAYQIYSADSSTQYLIADNRSSEDSMMHDIQMYPQVNSSEVIEQLTDKKMIYPNMMAGNWDDDFTNYTENQNSSYYNDDDDDED